MRSATKKLSAGISSDSTPMTVAVDTEDVSDPELVQDGEPRTSAAADVDRALKRDEFEQERHNHLGGPP